MFPLLLVKDGHKASETLHASISMLLKTARVCQDKCYAFALHAAVKMSFLTHTMFLKTQVATVHAPVHELVQVTGTVWVALLASVEVVLGQALKELILCPQSMEVLQQTSVFASVCSDTPVDAFYLLQWSVCAAYFAAEGVVGNYGSPVNGCLLQHSWVLTPKCFQSHVLLCSAALQKEHCGFAPADLALPPLSFS